jgi:hypothetical protein
MKYGGEFCKRLLCGTWFERIGDVSDEGNEQINL